MKFTMLFNQMLYRSLLFVVCFIPVFGISQSLGTVSYDYSNTSDGYVLFSPRGYTDSYLIDNCGRIINEWQGSFTNATASYLDSTGNLVKCITDDNNQYIDGGGGYDRIVRMDWNGSSTMNATSQKASSMGLTSKCGTPKQILLFDKNSVGV